MSVAGAAERYRKVKDFGDWKEIENYIIAPNMGNTNPRAPRTKRTKSAVQKVNQRHAAERLEDKIRANFRPGDKYITLTFADKALPGSREAACKIWNAFVKRLRRRCDKLGIVLKYCRTIEQGERKGRWHIHCIINDAVPYEMIRSCWERCGSIFVRALWNDGFGLANVHNLAEYFVGVNKAKKSLAEKKKSEKTYSFSANCREPKVTYESMSARWLKTPRVPKGWLLLPNSLEEYEDSYGLKHQRYIIRKNDASERSDKPTPSKDSAAYCREHSGTGRKEIVQSIRELSEIVQNFDASTLAQVFKLYKKKE